MIFQRHRSRALYRMHCHLEMVLKPNHRVVRQTHSFIWQSVINMDYVFSPSQNLFFKTEYYERYIKNESWPQDAIAVNFDVFIMYSGSAPDGKIRGVDHDGIPCWIDVPPLTRDELIQQADEEKRRMISYASNVINNNMWQTKLQLGRITDDEKAQLNLWLDYIDAVNAIDTLTAPDIQWPTPPAE